MRRFPTVDRFGVSLLLALGFAGCQDNATDGPSGETLQDTSGTTTAPDTSGTTTASDTSGTTTASDTSGTTSGTDTADTDTADTDTAEVIDPPTPCGVSTPVLSASGQETGFERCESGALHRVKAVECATSLPRDQQCVPFGSDPGTCATDADCPTNATCDADQWWGGCVCSQGCVSDADCGVDQFCRCGELIGRCVWSECMTDAECGEGLLCIEQRSCEFSGLAGFSCQTPQDTCDDQEDCGPFEPFGGPFCMKPAPDQPFQCYVPGCPIPGRPFLVEDAARLAPVAARTDWSLPDLCPSLTGLSGAQRQVLADHWTRIGLMEHASVAAFARSAMQLMALGAPPGLLIQTQAAMSDETRHARQAFAIASAYAGAPVGPGPLCIDGALERLDLLSVVEMTIHEGCIGETVAAIEASEAAERTEDPVIKSVLAAIAHDEGQHAALAWRTIQWALGLSDSSVRAHVKATFEAALSQGPQHPLVARPQDDADARLGVIGGDLGQELKRQALRRVIAPCLQRVLGQPSDADEALRAQKPRLSAC